MTAEARFDSPAGLKREQHYGHYPQRDGWTAGDAMNWFEFILATLAVWRITHLIAAEDGPFKLIAWLRGKAGQGFWGTLLDCFYCLSLWIAIPFAVTMGGSRWQKFLLWPALSAAAILLNRFVDKIAPDPPVYFEEPEAKVKEEA